MDALHMRLSQVDTCGFSYPYYVHDLADLCHRRKTHETSPSVLRALARGAFLTTENLMPRRVYSQIDPFRPQIYHYLSIVSVLSFYFKHTGCHSGKSLSFIFLKECRKSKYTS